MKSLTLEELRLLFSLRIHWRLSAILKIMQQKCIKESLLICKSIYILQVYSIYYTLREFTKLPAFVPYAPSCFRALRTLTPYVPWFWRALIMRLARLIYYLRPLLTRDIYSISIFSELIVSVDMCLLLLYFSLLSFIINSFQFGLKIVQSEKELWLIKKNTQ